MVRVATDDTATPAPSHNSTDETMPKRSTPTVTGMPGGGVGMSHIAITTRTGMLAMLVSQKVRLPVDGMRMARVTVVMFMASSAPRASLSLVPWPMTAHAV